MSRKAKMSAKVRAKHHGRRVRQLEKFAKTGKGAVKVGLPKGGANPYPDGTSVIDVGVWNEFGTETIPERSFLRAGIREGAPAYRRLNRRNLIKMREGEKTSDQAMGELGLKAAGDVQEMVLDVKQPPNAPRTIARKGSENPLIDTGHLRQSITHEVIK